MGAGLFFYVGLFIGRQGHAKEGDDSPQGQREFSARRNQVDLEIHRGGKSSYQPLRDKRGFLALEDFSTQEERLIAWCRMVDGATPENIQHLVDEYLHMTPGALMRLRELTGYWNMEHLLMQRYGNLLGETALLHLIKTDENSAIESVIKGFVEKNPQAAMAFFRSEPSNFNDNATRTFVNETALAVLQNKIPLAEWKRLLESDVASEIPLTEYAGFINVISALKDGRVLSKTETDELDVVDVDRLVGNAPEYINLLNELTRADYLLEPTQDVLRLDDLTPEQRIASVRDIAADQSITPTQKAGLLRQYLDPSGYDKLREEFSSSWKLLDKDTQAALIESNTNEVFSLEYDAQEMSSLISDAQDFDERARTLFRRQEDAGRVLQTAEFLNSDQRKRMVNAALNESCEVEDIVKWADDARYLSEDEFQWIEKRIQLEQEFKQAQTAIRESLDELEEGP